MVVGQKPPALAKNSLHTFCTCPLSRVGKARLADSSFIQYKVVFVFKFIFSSVKYLINLTMSFRGTGRGGILIILFARG